MRVEFDGGALSGFQRQLGVRTVQAELEAAWQRWLGEAVHAASSSRTDAGVHARAMPVLVRTAAEVPDKAVVFGMNAMLPDDIAVISAQQMPETFHVRHDAVGKRYIYRLRVSPVRSPLRRRDRWHIRHQALDVAAMQRAALAMQGEHDFAGFRAASCVARSTVRSLSRVEVSGEGEALEIAVEGNAFLQNMVRIIAGTLVEVGKGRKDAGDIPAVLASGDRKQAGPTAPAHGLTLDEVFYGPPGARQGLEHKQLLSRLALRDR